MQPDGIHPNAQGQQIVVSHEEITRYGDTNVLDVLKRLPGVTVDDPWGGGHDA